MMMGAAQLDRYGNQNISCIGDWARPKAQLLGVRGAPGNTVNHPVSYWVPRHSRRVVRRARRHGQRHRLRPGRARRAFHELRSVVTNLAVLDFRTPDHAMRLRSVHPGVSVADVPTRPGSSWPCPSDVAVTGGRRPAELALIRLGLTRDGLPERGDCA